MADKELFINATRLVEIDGNTNIPTVLHYSTTGGVLFGSAALAASRGRYQLNEGFKVDLGNIDPTAKLPAAKFSTASNVRKSAVGLTFDFLYGVLQASREWLEENSIEQCTSILLAEPLAMQGDLVGADWLSNYRRNLERMVIGWNFDKIDFLPEPFAVFQYYRYGLKHPLLADRAKQQALVVDFGGGTFDVCIIETTREGDISQTGRHSRPLAASSEAVGGFYVNQLIAEEMFKKCVAKERRGKLNTGLEQYRKWRREDADLRALAPEYQNFVKNFHDTIYRIEALKLALCMNIADWSLDASLDLKAAMDLSADPFSESEKTVNIGFSAVELRELFVNKIWPGRLKPIIKRTLDRGKDELSGAPISVVLLSGGSANIRWLDQLFRRDFGAQLSEAQTLHLPNYQEVVAKGLAVECARRFHTDDGDFSAVTYNRLCLVLNADGTGLQIRSFVPRTEKLLSEPPSPGVLLPSASILKRFIDGPMKWRVRLDHPPRQRLDYYFLRSSFDPDDIENLQNIEERTIYSPKDCAFDGALQLELTVKQDGTALPRFIYHQGRTEAETISVTARPFCLDMTYGQTAPPSKAYMGLDFGTTNTSISFVDAASVQLYKKRGAERFWNDLSDLTSTLPYPLAITLRKYLGQSDPSSLIKSALEFFEAALAVAAYVTYLELCTSKGQRESRLLKGYTQRSVRPLWALLKDSLAQLGKNASISAAYEELLFPGLGQSMEEAINFFNEYKHDKVSPKAFDILRPVEILANVSQKVFGKNVFGFFEQVRKERFGKNYHGLFRFACGPEPFIRASEYEGSRSFAEGETFVINQGKGNGLALQPLIFWDECPDHPDLNAGHCYLFDKSQGNDGDFSFKAAGYPCTCKVSKTNKYAELANELVRYRSCDPDLAIATQLNFPSVDDR